MVIVELTGLPGCGKSTAVHNIMVKYIEPKDNALTRDEFLKGTGRTGNRRLRILKTILTPHNWYFLFHLMCICVTYHAQIRRIYSILILYDALKTNNTTKLVILDEGPLQYLTSLSYRKIMAYDSHIQTCLDILNSFCNLIPVYCMCPVEECVARIKKRNRRDRYTTPDLLKQKKLLQIKLTNIENILDWSNKNYITVSMLQNENEIAQEIRLQLEKKGICFEKE